MEKKEELVVDPKVDKLLQDYFDQRRAEDEKKKNQVLENILAELRK